jgi:uncharacterized phiE125 gp8 family phage protein
MPVQTITPPVARATSLALVKQHLRVIADEEDDLLLHYIDAATLHFEKLSGRSLITQTLKYSFGNFPCQDFFLIQRGAPLQSVTHIKYYDKDNVLQTLPTDNYSLSASGIPGKVFRTGDSWGVEDIHETRPDAVEVTFVAGYGADDSFVPGDIKLALSMLIGDSFSYRENTQTQPGIVQIKVDYGTNALIQPYRTEFFEFASQVRL